MSEGRRTGATMPRTRHDKDDSSSSSSDSSVSSSSSLRAHMCDAVAPHDVATLSTSTSQVQRQHPVHWRQHPCHVIVLALLQRRGLYTALYPHLTEYHMADLFLHYLAVCRAGAYFVLYTRHQRPKERFVRLRMLHAGGVDADEIDGVIDTAAWSWSSPPPLRGYGDSNHNNDSYARSAAVSCSQDAVTAAHVEPCLVWTLHHTAVDVCGVAPLHRLVDVTCDVTAASCNFAPHVVSSTTLLGCRQGRGHRARLPRSGAFSLWFAHKHDDDSSSRRHRRRPRGHHEGCYSVDLLTCDAKVYDVWVRTFRGLLSVNSSTVVQAPLQTLLPRAQQA